MSFFLLKEIEALLKEGFAQTRFRDTVKEERYRMPRFWLGTFPPKRSEPDQAEDFPFILNHFTEGEDNEGASMFTVKTICGIHTEEGVEGGTNEIANMIFRCRRLMLTKRTLAGRFVLQLPLKWSVGYVDEGHLQPHPKHGGAIITTWQAPGLVTEHTIEEEVEHYGAGIR